jgi:hypothetical protein
MKSCFTFAVAICLASAVAGQTRKIAFESHSGSEDHLAIALSDAFFDADGSDFGLPANAVVKSYKLDSVIFISESMALLIRRTYSHTIGDPSDSMKFTGSSRDTVFNDPLFSRKHSLDSIRMVLEKEKYYLNYKTMRRVKFIGYDNKKASKETHAFVSPVSINDPTTPGTTRPSFTPVIDAEGTLALSLIFLFSLAGALITWKLYRPSLERA